MLPFLTCRIIFVLGESQRCKPRDYSMFCKIVYVLEVEMRELLVLGPIGASRGRGIEAGVAISFVR